MADITETGPMTFRQLQKENELQKEQEMFENAKKVIKSGSVLPKFPARKKLNLTEEFYSGYAKSPMQQNAEAQGKNDYWGRSMFDDDNVPLAEWAEPAGLQDIRANNQPWYAQLGAGIGKAVTTAGTTYIDGVFGRLYGLAEGAGAMVDDLRNGKSFKEAAISGASKIFDNEFSNGVQEFNRIMEDILPNYRTSEEENTPWWTHINMNTIADGFIKNLGFTVGALYSGGTVLRALGAVKLAQNPMSALLAGSFFGALSEGSIEANNMVHDAYALHETQINDAYNKRLEEIYEKYGNAPEGTTYFDENGIITREQAMQNEISKLSATKDEMLQKTYRNLEKGGIVDLLGNLVILTIGNMLVFGRLFSRGFNTAKTLTARSGLSPWGQVRAGWKEAGSLAGNELAGKAGKEGGKYVWKDITRGKSLGAGLWITAAEGTEEMMQEFAAQTGGEMYSPDSPDAWYQAMIDNESDVKTQDFLTAAAKGFWQSWGDPNQWEQFAIGALTGALGVPTFGRVQNASSNTYLGRKAPIGLSGGIFGEFRHNAEVNRRGRGAVDIMNRLLDDVQKGKINMSQSSFFTDAMNGWVAANNKFEFQNAKDNELATAFNAFMSTGREADFREMVNLDFDNMSQEDLEKIARLMDSEGDKDVGNPQGQWRNADGTFMSNTKEGQAEMRKKLKENRDKTLKALDLYKESLLEVRRIGNESEELEKESELAWLWWKGKMAKSRFDDLSETRKDDINENIEVLKRQRDMLAGAISDVVGAHEGETRHKIAPLRKLGERISGKLNELKDRFVTSKDTEAETEEEAANPEAQENEEEKKETKKGKTRKKGKSGESAYSERFTVNGLQAYVDPKGQHTLEDIVAYRDAIDGWIRILEAVRDGDINMLASLFSNPLLGNMYREQVDMMGSREFYDVLGNDVIQPYEAYLDMFNDMADAAKLAVAYRNFSEKRDEYTRDPLALDRNRRRLDREERKKISRKERNEIEKRVNDADPSKLVGDLKNGAKNGGLDYKRASRSLGESKAGKKLQQGQKTLNLLERAANKAVERGANEQDIADLVNEAIGGLKSYDIDEVDIGKLTGKPILDRATQEAVKKYPNISNDEIIAIARRELAAAQDALARGITEVTGQNEKRENIPDKKPTKKKPETKTTTGHDKVEYHKPLGGEVVEGGNDEKGEKGDEGGDDQTTQMSKNGTVDTPTITKSDHEKNIDTENKANPNGDVQPGTDMTKPPRTLKKWKGPNTTEYPIKRKRGDDRPWHEIEVQKDSSAERKKLAEKHGIIHEYLKDMGAYSFMKSGLVRTGDKITFGVSKRLTKSLETKDTKGMPVILIMHNREVKDPKTGEVKVVKTVIGDLVSMIDRSCMDQYKWLAEFTNKVMTEYAKVEASLGDDDIYHVPNVESHITQMYVGKPMYSNSLEQHTLNQIHVNDQDERIPFTIGINRQESGKSQRRKGANVVAGSAVRPENIIQPQNAVNGQPFLLMPTADGKMLCVPVMTPTISDAPDDCTLMKIAAARIADIENIDLGDEDAVKKWKNSVEEVLAIRKLRVYAVRNKDGDPFIVVSVKGNRGSWKTVFKGSQEQAAEELLDTLIEYDANPEDSGLRIPLQVSLKHINGKIADADGNEISYNDALGEVMTTNLPVGQTHTINDFFNINPIGADGKEIVAGQGKGEKAKAPVKETNNNPISFDDCVEFELDGGKKAYMSKKAPYNVFDENGDPVDVSDETRAYLYCMSMGYSLDKEGLSFKTPFSNLEFSPYNMAFVQSDTTLESIPETAATDIQVGSERSEENPFFDKGPVKTLATKGGQVVVATIGGKKAAVYSYQLVLDNGYDGGVAVSVHHAGNLDGEGVTNTTIGLKDLPQELATFIAKDSKDLIAKYKKEAKRLKESAKATRAAASFVDAMGDFSHADLERTGKDGSLEGELHSSMSKPQSLPLSEKLVKLLRRRSPLSSVEVTGVHVKVVDGQPKTVTLDCNVTYKDGKTMVVKTSPTSIGSVDDIGINAVGLDRMASEAIMDAAKVKSPLHGTKSEASKRSSLVPEVDKNDIGAKVGDNEYVDKIEIEPYSSAGMGRGVEVSLKDGQGNNGVVIKKLPGWMDAALKRKELVDRYTLPSRHLKEIRLTSFSTREYWLEQKNPRIQYRVILEFDDGHSFSVREFTDLGEIAETRPMITDMIRKYLSREAPTLQQSSSISYTNPRASGETSITVMDVVDADGNPASVKLQNASHVVPRLISRSNKFSMNMHWKDVASVKVNRVRINDDGSFNSADITIVRNDGKEFTDTLTMYDFREMNIDEPFSFLGLDKEAIAAATTQPQQQEQPQAQPETKPEAKPEVPTGNFADVYVAATAPNSGVQKATPISSNVEVPDGGIKRNKATKAIEIKPVDKDTGGPVRMPLLKEIASHVVNTNDVTSVNLDGVYVSNKVYNDNGTVAMRVTVEHSDGTTEKVDISIAKEAIGEYLNGALKAFMDSEKQSRTRSVKPIYGTSRGNDGQLDDGIADKIGEAVRQYPKIKNLRSVLDAIASDGSLVDGLIGELGYTDAQRLVQKLGGKSQAQIMVEVKKYLGDGVDSAARFKAAENEAPRIPKNGIWDRARELRVLARILPQLSHECRIAIVDGMIKIYDKAGQEAYGKFLHGVITISENAETGTSYHEAFHYVFNTLLSDTEKDTLLKAGEKRFGIVGLIAIEEKLADDFQKYMVEETYSEMGRFKRIWHKLKRMVWAIRTHRNAIDRLYRSIASGKFGYEGRDAKVSGMAAEIEFLQDIAERNEDGELLANNGKRSNLSPMRHALVRTREFNAWRDEYVLLDENDEPCVLYLNPNSRMGEFTLEPTTDADMAFFAKGAFRYNKNTGTVHMRGPFQFMSADNISRYATYAPGTRTSSISGAMDIDSVTDDDIRRYHEWKTSYDRLTKEQRDFLGYGDTVEKEWESLPADVREKALACAY